MVQMVNFCLLAGLDVTTLNAIKVIPDQCCSFPFSFNGVIYNNCTKNVNPLYPNSPGCFMAGRVKAYCVNPPGSPGCTCTFTSLI